MESESWRVISGAYDLFLTLSWFSSMDPINYSIMQTCSWSVPWLSLGKVRIINSSTSQHTRVTSFFLSLYISAVGSTWSQYNIPPFLLLFVDFATPVLPQKNPLYYKMAMTCSLPHYYADVLWFQIFIGPWMWANCHQFHLFYSGGEKKWIKKQRHKLFYFYLFSIQDSKKCIFFYIHSNYCCWCVMAFCIHF